MASSDDYVTLVRGPVLPGAVVALAVDLEARGFDLRAQGDRLLVGPVDALTPADVDAIKRWRHHLLALVAYVEAEPWSAVQ